MKKKLAFLLAMLILVLAGCRGNQSGVATEQPKDDDPAASAPAEDFSLPPTEAPTVTPSEEPSEPAGPEPSEEPTESVTPEPSEEPDESAAPEPSGAPAESDTPEPSEEPAESAGPEPSEAPETGNHVADSTLDIPEGFEQRERDGVAASWYRESDGSSINLVITEINSAIETTYRFATASMLRVIAIDYLERIYGVEPATVTDRYFTKNQMCGLPAVQYSYNVEYDAGQGVTSFSQVTVSIMADQLYTFIYTTADADTLALFDASARNIQLVLE